MTGKISNVPIADEAGHQGIYVSSASVQRSIKRQELSSSVQLCPASLVQQEIRPITYSRPVGRQRRYVCQNHV